MVPSCVNPQAYRSYQVSYPTCRKELNLLDYCAPTASGRALLEETSDGRHARGGLLRGGAGGGRRAGCAGGRNVYIDMGANWCNTLQLFKLLPEAATKAWGSTGGGPWEVFAFEAAPLIQPFVQKCCDALTLGRSLPESPLPPAGSSIQLLHYGPALGCVKGGRGERLRCILRALERPLAELRVDPALTANATLLDARLASASRRRRCKRREPAATYTLVPAAAGAMRSTIRMAGSPMQTIRGGISSMGKNIEKSATPTAPAADDKTMFDVAMVDVVRWIEDSFSEDDFVVLKMDIEGAERTIIPALLARNTSRRIDMLLWECHLKWRGVPGKCQCAAWEEELKNTGGVKAVYHEPYPFAGKEAMRGPKWAPPSGAIGSAAPTG